MRTVLDIVLNDLRIFFSRRGNWVSVVLLPLAFTTLLGWALGGPDSEAAPEFRVDFVDLDDTPASLRLAARLQASNPALLLCPPPGNAPQASDDDGCRLTDEALPLSMEAALDRLQRGRTTALILVPTGFDAASAAGRSVEIEYYSLEDPTTPSPVLQSLQTVVQEFNGIGVAQAVGLELVDTLLDAATVDNASVDNAGGLAVTTARDEFATIYRQNLTARVESQPARVTFVTTAPLSGDGSRSGFEQAVPGMGSLFVMFTVLGGMSALLTERRQWTLQRLAVAPVSRGQILAGKAGSYFTLGMIQYSVVFSVGALVGINLGGAPFALSAVMIAFVLCITGLTFALAPHMRNESQASGLARLLALTLAPLGGAWWPLAIVPPFMQTIGHLSPVAWAMDAFQTLIWYGGGFGDILVQLGVLLVAAAALFGIGVLSFRVEGR